MRITDNRHMIRSVHIDAVRWFDHGYEPLENPDQVWGEFHKRMTEMLKSKNAEHFLVRKFGGGIYLFAGEQNFSLTTTENMLRDLCRNLEMMDRIALELKQSDSKFYSQPFEFFVLEFYSHEKGISEHIELIPMKLRADDVIYLMNRYEEAVWRYRDIQTALRVGNYDQEKLNYWTNVLTDALEEVCAYFPERKAEFPLHNQTVDTWMQKVTGLLSAEDHLLQCTLASGDVTASVWFFNLRTSISM